MNWRLKLMGIKFKLGAACAAILLTAGLATAQGPANADRTTYVTFSGPVSLPGVTLPAGEYLFRLADSLSNRNIVQVFDKNRDKIYATILAVPARRPEPTDDAIVTFREMPSDRPPAVHYWYYAGERSGQEFAYPKAEATRIANASGEPVLAVDTDSASIEDMQKGEITRVQPNQATTTQPEPNAAPAASAPPAQPETPAPRAQEPAPATTSPAPSSATTGTTGTSGANAPAATAMSGTTAQSQQPTPAPTPQRTQPRRTELPKTASELPLVGFIGLSALAAALGLGALRRRLV
jgi:LPXTG-motif cell wall-anchored protein